jgi:hypothetical protein
MACLLQTGSKKNTKFTKKAQRAAKPLRINPDLQLSQIFIGEYRPQSFSTSLAITIFWISEVPSPMVQSLESR